MRNDNLTVVKLGGSHFGSPHLNHWLDILAACDAHVILVPGGGPFADAVRTAQSTLAFDDYAAHHMALLAMEQFGRALVALRPGFEIADSQIAIRRVLEAGAVPIWSPPKMVLRATEIPASWDVTSDSLAAWLANQIGAKRLLLVKHGHWPDESAQADELVKRGVVDKAFPRFLAAGGAAASIVGPAAHAAVGTAIRTGKPIGTCIGLHESGARRLLSPLWQRSKHRAGDGP